MKCPALLIAAALLFWGWQTGYWPPAIAMAGATAAVLAVKRRWELTPRDFYRVADGCALIIMALTAYRFIADTGSMARWLPMGLFPLLAAQAYSSGSGVDLGAIFYIVRRKEKKGQAKDRQRVDISFVYLALTLVATSAANGQGHVFFGGLTILTGWGLWCVRPKSRPVALWLALWLGAGMLGFAGQIGLHRLQVWLETEVLEWLVEPPAQRDPLQNRTAIGLIGELKRSDKIVMRVVPEGSFSASLLLAEAVYNRYAGAVWSTDQQGFARLAPVSGDGRWSLGPEPVELRQIRITRYFTQGKGLVGLPAATVDIGGLPAATMERSRLGTVRVSGAPHLASYRVRYAAGEVARAGPPEPADVQVPGLEAAMLERFLTENGMAHLPAHQLVPALEDHFRRHFTYRLFQEQPLIGSGPLARFLFDSHAGHCEFFATATVLLLRAGGVPARYATGYLVADYSGLEKVFVVRSRHAHAWALAFVDGTWQIVDTTPGAWPEFEQQLRPWYRPVADLASWVWLAFNGWRQQSRSLPSWLPWLGWAAAAVVAVVLLKLVVFGKRATGVQRQKGRLPTSVAVIPSPLDRIEAFWAAKGVGRHRWETLGAWVQRLARGDVTADQIASLAPIVRLHQRLRFHPGGLSAPMMDQLRQQVDAYFKKADAFVRNSKHEIRNPKQIQRTE